MSRRSPVAALLALALAAPAAAQHAGHGEHAPAAAPPEVHAHPITAPSLPPITDEVRAAAFPDLSDMRMTEMMTGDPLNRFVLLDRLERRDATGSPLTFEVDAWVGHDLAKLWVRAEGERRSHDTERAELSLLWGKGFSRWWSILAGARRDFQPSPSAHWAAFGVRGFAPYRFDVAATAFVGEGGQTALRIETQHDILITNRLILEPELEVDWYGRTNRARGIGAGLASAELGLRLRYEFRREVAPYVGLVRERSFGTTAEHGGRRDDTSLVAGIRLWF